MPPDKKSLLRRVDLCRNEQLVRAWFRLMIPPPPSGVAGVSLSRNSASGLPSLCSATKERMSDALQDPPDEVGTL